MDDGSCTWKFTEPSCNVPYYLFVRSAPAVTTPSASAVSAAQPIMCTWSMVSSLCPVLASICTPPERRGCTDPTAFNRDVNANKNDGSCLYRGCTVATASNFDSRATTEDGSCAYPVIGCMKAEASNFRAAAM